MMGELKKWEIVRSHLAFDHPWCRVRRDVVRLPDGTEIDDFFVNVRPDIALVVPITPDQEVICVRQYRHGVQQILLELPAGAFDPTQEDSQTAAERELEEETGYIAPDWHKLATLYDNPVKDTNAVHLFLAQNAQPTGTQALDPTETLAVELIPLRQIEQHIRDGEICVAGTVTALFLALRHLERGRDREARS